MRRVRVSASVMSDKTRHAWNDHAAAAAADDDAHAYGCRIVQVVAVGMLTIYGAQLTFRRLDFSVSKRSQIALERSLLWMQGAEVG